jgi:hypothetical protein
MIMYLYGRVLLTEPISQSGPYSEAFRTNKVWLLPGENFSVIMHYPRVLLTEPISQPI